MLHEKILEERNAVNFYAYEIFVKKLYYLFIFKTFFCHYMTPVAPNGT